MKKKIIALFLVLALSACFLTACGGIADSAANLIIDSLTDEMWDAYLLEEDVDYSDEAPDVTDYDEGGDVSLNAIPAYTEYAYIAINNNTPYFTEADMTTASFEDYSELDSLGRCGVCFANIGSDLMPTEARGSIGSVKPTGWQTVKYDCVEGKYLYNRCHLIGYQLTGENANKKNLITGTRYLNIQGMLPFENMVADYLKENKDNHVLYRVTPLYTGNNLVANGVLMEGKSVEDNGEDILFCVYCYNVQPGVTINYADGTSQLAQ